MQNTRTRDGSGVIFLVAVHLGAGEKLHGGADEVLMGDVSWLEVEEIKDHLHNRATAEDEDDGAEADWAAEYKADDEHKKEEGGLYGTDWNLWKTLAEGEHEGVTWATAKACGDIEILSEGDDGHGDKE